MILVPRIVDFDPRLTPLLSHTVGVMTVDV